VSCLVEGRPPRAETTVTGSATPFDPSPLHQCKSQGCDEEVEEEGNEKTSAVQKEHEESPAFTIWSLDTEIVGTKEDDRLSIRNRLKLPNCTVTSDISRVVCLLGISQKPKHACVHHAFFFFPCGHAMHL
jgi:hypothetical protein